MPRNPPVLDTISTLLDDLKGMPPHANRDPALALASANKDRAFMHDAKSPDGTKDIGSSTSRELEAMRKEWVDRLTECKQAASPHLDATIDTRIAAINTAFANAQRDLAVEYNNIISGNVAAGGQTRWLDVMQTMKTAIDAAVPGGAAGGPPIAAIALPAAGAPYSAAATAAVADLVAFETAKKTKVNECAGPEKYKQELDKIKVSMEGQKQTLSTTNKNIQIAAARGYYSRVPAPVGRTNKQIWKKQGGKSEKEIEADNNVILAANTGESYDEFRKRLDKFLEDSKKGGVFKSKNSELLIYFDERTNTVSCRAGGSATDPENLRELIDFLRIKGSTEISPVLGSNKQRQEDGTYDLNSSDLAYMETVLKAVERDGDVTANLNEYRLTLEELQAGDSRLKDKAKALLDLEKSINDRALLNTDKLTEDLTAAMDRVSDAKMADFPGPPPPLDRAAVLPRLTQLDAEYELVIKQAKQLEKLASKYPDLDVVSGQRGVPGHPSHMEKLEQLAAKIDAKRQNIIAVGGVAAAGAAVGAAGAAVSADERTKMQNQSGRMLNANNDASAAIADKGRAHAAAIGMGR